MISFFNFLIDYYLNLIILFFSKYLTEFLTLIHCVNSELFFKNYINFDNILKDLLNNNYLINDFNLIEFQKVENSFISDGLLNFEEFIT